MANNCIVWRVVRNYEAGAADGSEVTRASLALRAIHISSDKHGDKLVILQ